MSLFALTILAFFGMFLVFLYTKFKSQHIKREQELEKQKKELEKEIDLLSSQVNDAIFILNSNGEIVKTNLIVKNMYGYDPSELIGKTIDVVCKS